MLIGWYELQRDLLVAQAEGAKSIMLWCSVNGPRRP